MCFKAYWTICFLESISMKRSRHIKLVILASAGVFGLAACDSQESSSYNQVDETVEQDLGAIFSSRAECEKVYTADECLQNELYAEANHFSSAPKYNAQSECEAQHGTGKCTSAQTSSGSVFLPLMMGYMMGRSSSGTAVAQPLYRTEDRDRRYGGGTVISSGGRYVGRSAPATGSLGPSTSVRVRGVPTTTFRPSSTLNGRTFSAPSSVSRGVFGSSSRSFGSVSS